LLKDLGDGGPLVSAVVTVGKVIYFGKLKPQAQLQTQNKLGFRYDMTKDKQLGKTPLRVSG
jgi:hypothetical protein